MEPSTHRHRHRTHRTRDPEVEDPEPAGHRQRRHRHRHHRQQNGIENEVVELEFNMYANELDQNSQYGTYHYHGDHADSKKIDTHEKKYSHMSSHYGEYRNAPGYFTPPTEKAVPTGVYAPVE